MRFVITMNSNAHHLGINEINRIFVDAKIVKDVKPGIAIINTTESKEEVYKKIEKFTPTFIRHMTPINIQEKLGNVDSNFVAKIKDLIVEELITKNNNNENLSVSVQDYKMHDPKTDSKGNAIKEEEIYNVKDLRHEIIDFVASKSDSITIDVKNPEYIIGLVYDRENLYVGVNEVMKEFTNWMGGNIRFRTEKEQISRAEFKLLEADALWNINKGTGLALDLGASPGGFTRILYNWGYKVVAVDPAYLDDKLRKVDKSIIKHEMTTAGEYFRNTKDKRKFDIIVNDMKMDYNNSIDIIIEAVDFLKDDGIILMTLKLPKERWQTHTIRAAKILEKYYKVVGMRQLFHNRSEVTFIMKKA